MAWAASLGTKRIEATPSVASLLCCTCNHADSILHTLQDLWCNCCAALDHADMTPHLPLLPCTDIRGWSGWRARQRSTWGLHFLWRRCSAAGRAPRRAGCAAPAALGGPAAMLGGGRLQWPDEQAGRWLLFVLAGRPVPAAAAAGAGVHASVKGGWWAMQAA